MSTTTAPHRPRLVQAGRAILIPAGAELGPIGVWVVSAALGWAWYQFLIPSSHQSLRSIGCTVIVLGLGSLLNWGRKVAVTCPHCRARHKAGAAVCSHCGREVPSTRERIAS